MLDTQTVFLSIIALTALGMPLLITHFTNKTRIAHRAEDYRRQDSVAARVETTRLKAAEAAGLVREVGRKLDTSSNEMSIKLDDIHTLVNSQMTAAMQTALDATKRQLVSLKEVIELKKSMGHEPSEEASREIVDTEKKIEELQAQLMDRLKASEVVLDRLRSRN